MADDQVPTTTIFKIPEHDGLTPSVRAALAIAAGQWGALMRAAQDAWRRGLLETGSSGGEFAVGPPTGLLTPCVCAEPGSKSSPQPSGSVWCVWCAGMGLVTDRVRLMAGK